MHMHAITNHNHNLNPTHSAHHSNVQPGNTCHYCCLVQPLLYCCTATWLSTPTAGVAKAMPKHTCTSVHLRFASLM